LGPHDSYQYEDELIHITQARVFMAQNRHDQALKVLSHLEETARSSGRVGRLIEIMLLKALVLQAAGDTPQAHAALAKSLAMAEPGRYVRIFLDEGQPMRKLIAHWLSQVSDSPLRDYAIHLLSQLDAESDAVSSGQAKASKPGVPSASSGQALIEPLSQRELEVLQHIALGRTNQQIALQLIVSPGTVKAHTASIYRKLDVANRTEAVARARQLGILP